MGSLMTARTPPWRLARLLVAVAVAVGAWTPADAKIHSLSGNARLQMGKILDLPIPIGFTAPPAGKIMAVPGATIRLHGVHSVTNPAAVVLDPSQLTHPGTATVLPIYANNSNVFQVKTAIPLQFPKSKILFRENGRTGAPTVTVCPGSTVTKNGNPGCSTALAGVIPGRLTYTRTSHQFGGPARFAGQGVADVALKAGTSPPCSFGTNPNCLVIFASIVPPFNVPLGHWGFGAGTSSQPGAPSPGLFGVAVTGGGLILSLQVPLGPGLPNPLASYGGPWTTGMVKVEQPAAAAGLETFTLTGSDDRAQTVSSTPVPSSQTLNGTGALS